MLKTYSSPLQIRLPRLLASWLWVCVQEPCCLLSTLSCFQLHHHLVSCNGPSRVTSALQHNLCCEAHETSHCRSAVKLLVNLIHIGNMPYHCIKRTAGGQARPNPPHAELQRPTAPTLWDATVAQPPEYRTDAALVRLHGVQGFRAAQTPAPAAACAFMCPASRLQCSCPRSEKDKYCCTHTALISLLLSTALAAGPGSEVGELGEIQKVQSCRPG